MKKILALVLALTLVLCAASAFATDSVEYPPTRRTPTTRTSTEEVEEPVGVTRSGDNDGTTEIKQQILDGQLEGLPDEIKNKIPGDHTKINEAVTFILTGDITKVTSATLTFSFETKYAEGEEVTILIGIAGANGTEWIVLTGKGDANGDVVVTVDKATLDKIGSNPFVVIPVSK